MKNSAIWHEERYGQIGLSAQRHFPNEELIRFMARRLFHKKDRGNIKILEVGCGTGANLIAIDREDFDAYGLDTSQSAIAICGNYMLREQLKVADMRETPYADATFDCVVDVFSSYCLDEQQFGVFIDEVNRILKPGGLFFSYTPGKRSDAFIHAENHIDASTIAGIPDGFAYSGNEYPFRFISADEYQLTLSERGFCVDYLETVTKTYRGGEELFEFIVVEAQRSTQ